MAFLERLQLKQNGYMRRKVNILCCPGILIAIIIKTAGTPNARGKQVSSPKQCTSSLKIGVNIVEKRDPKLTEKKNIAKNCATSRSCCGRINWSPPKGSTHGFIPPVPEAIRNNPKRKSILMKKLQVSAYLKGRILCEAIQEV